MGARLAPISWLARRWAAFSIAPPSSVGRLTSPGTLTLFYNLRPRLAERTMPTCPRAFVRKLGKVRRVFFLFFRFFFFFFFFFFFCFFRPPLRTRTAFCTPRSIRSKQALNHPGRTKTEVLLLLPETVTTPFANDNATDGIGDSRLRTDIVDRPLPFSSLGPRTDHLLVTVARRPSDYYYTPNLGQGTLAWP